MPAKTGRTFIGRFLMGSDLLAALTDLAQQQHIQAATFSLLGSVSSMAYAYYNQVTQKYIHHIRPDERWEIIVCHGNISRKDSQPFVHAHILYADQEGHSLGGHLIAGNKIFAAEYFVQEWDDVALERQSDKETGLALWAPGGN